MPTANTMDPYIKRIRKSISIRLFETVVRWLPCLDEEWHQHWLLAATDVTDGSTSASADYFVLKHRVILT